MGQSGAAQRQLISVHLGQLTGEGIGFPVLNMKMSRASGDEDSVLEVTAESGSQISNRCHDSV